MVTKVMIHLHPASTFAFSVPFPPTYQSRNRLTSFHLLSQQQANEVLRHDPPMSRLRDSDISAGPSFPSMRFDHLEQSFGRQPRRMPYPSSPTVWPAPGSEDTELGVLMELEVGHGETEVYPGVQA
jgi:hypothetical protein